MSRYTPPQPTCHHISTDTLVYAGDITGHPYASVWVWPRPECVKDAVEWAYASTHQTPVVEKHAVGHG